jgi:hypothetical protein
MAGTAIVERLMYVGKILFVLVMVLSWMKVPGLIIRSGVIFLGGFGILVTLLRIKFQEPSFTFVNWVCAHLHFPTKSLILARMRELIEGLTPLLDGSVASTVIVRSRLTWMFYEVV